MPPREPTDCREQLATLMRDANAQLAALEGLLVREYALLQSGEVEDLEKAGTERQQCVGQVLRIEDERRALCRATGRSEDAAGLHSLLAWCDPTGLLLPVIQEYRDRTQRCRDQNDRNGMLVNGRLQGESGTPRVADGTVREGRAYGPGSDDSGYGHKLSTRA